MTIQAGSRYEDSEVTTVAVNGRDRMVIVPGPQAPYTFTYTSYQWRGGDRVDSIAFDNYGHEDKWFAIADANPEIMNWMDVKSGTLIRIPAIT